MGGYSGLLSKLTPARLLRELVGIFKEIIVYFPGRTGYALRRLLVKTTVKKLGSGISFGMGVEITGGENIKMGSRVSIMRFSSLYAHDGTIEMGSDISINANTQISAADGGKVVMGDNVMIGPNVVFESERSWFQ